MSSSQAAAGPSRRGVKRPAGRAPIPFLNRFVSNEHRKFYETHYAKCAVIVERYVDEEKVAPEFCEMIRARGWPGMLAVDDTKKVNETVAREFCANLNRADLEQDFVRVRGVNVLFSPQIIREEIGLPDVPRDYVHHLRVLESRGVDWMEEVRQMACPDARWIIGAENNRKGLHFKDVTDEDERVIFRFIHNRLAPKDGPGTLSIDDLGMYYALRKELPVSLGRLYYNLFEGHIGQRNRCVFFPRLINTLCRDAGVPEYAEDIRTRRLQPIKRMPIASRAAPNQPAAPAAPAAHFDMSAEHREFLSVHDSMRVFMQQQHEENMRAHRANFYRETEVDPRIFESHVDYHFADGIEQRMSMIKLQDEQNREDAPEGGE